MRRPGNFSGNGAGWPSPRFTSLGATRFISPGPRTTGRCLSGDAARASRRSVRQARLRVFIIDWKPRPIARLCSTREPVWAGPTAHPAICRESQCRQSQDARLPEIQHDLPVAQAVAELRHEFGIRPDVFNNNPFDVVHDRGPQWLRRSIALQPLGKPATLHGAI
jgi:hypothetical protein